MESQPSLKILNSGKNPEARIFLLLDLREFFFRFRVRGRRKKSSENDQLTGHFQSFFFSELFFNISRKTVKLER